MTTEVSFSPRWELVVRKWLTPWTLDLVDFVDSSDLFDPIDQFIGA